MDAMKLVPDNALPVVRANLWQGGAQLCEVHVWHEDEFRQQDVGGVAGVHLVIGPVATGAPSTNDAAALYAGISAGNLRLVLQVDPAHEAAPLPAPPRGGLAPRALRRVRAHVEARLAEKIDLATMARLTGLSAAHFARSFKQSVGVSPYRYVLSRRIDVAAKLIESTDRPLAEIALEVGFSDQSHFTRTFAELAGDTPRAYRRKLR